MFKNRLILFILLVFFISCKQRIQQKELSIVRMDKDLFECSPENIKDSIPFFYQKYGQFFSVFTENIINIGDSSNPSFSEYLTNFVTDYGVNNAYQKSIVIYSNLTDIEENLGNAFARYECWFPGARMPKLYAYISGYSQGIAAIDTMVGIGLDMYLGREFEGYKIMWPDKKYKYYNLHKNKIVSDCIQFWAISQFPFVSEQNHVLSNILYYGKIEYFSKQLTQENDTLIFGFSPDQMKWCYNNEEQMWTFLVEHKMLYNSDYIMINKLVTDGPFTSFFTKESPAKAAVWLGYRIVESYMKNNNEITLKQLMLENDGLKILRLSKYKP